jgi:Uma2 family endonuclease
MRADSVWAMGLAQSIKRYTPEEYYALERQAAYKSDYYDGEIFAMSGGSSRHSLIVMNIGGELRQQLKGKPCAPYESNLRLTVKATGLRAYPDVSVYCGQLEYDDEDHQTETATNPTVLFEVLSPSTEAYDRGFKSENYRKIASLRAYVLVAQETPHIEVYERQADNSWLLREEDRLDGAIHLPAISVILSPAEIYDRIAFPPTDVPPRPKAAET